MQRAIRYDPVEHALFVGDVRIDDKSVLKEATRWTAGQRGVSVPDRDALAAADLTPFLGEAFFLGAKVLANAGQERETGAIDDAVRRATVQIEQATRRAMDDTEAAVRRIHDNVADTARGVQESVMARVSELIGGEHPELIERLRPVLDGVGATIETQVASAVERATEGMQSTAEKRHEQVSVMLHDVHREVAVRNAKDETTARLKSVTTIKGFDYEEALNVVFSEMATAMGDDYVACGENAGLLPRNKKGDGVFRVNGSTAKVVIEAHDGVSKEWSSYLAEAERNRDAVASIGVVRKIEDNKGHLLRVLGPRRVVVAYDPYEDDVDFVRSVVLLMRTVALTHTGRFGVEEIATAHSCIEDARAALTGLDEATRSANAIIGHVDKVNLAVRSTTAAVQRSLQSAITALIGAGSAIEEEADPGEETLTA